MKVSLPRLDAKSLSEVPQLVGVLNGYFGQLDAALQGQLGLENLRLELVEATAKIPDPTWTAPTLLNSWANIGGTDNPVGYIMEPGGWVVIRGRVSTGTVGNAFFTLPAAYRPAYNCHFINVCEDGASNRAPYQMTVFSSGNVGPYQVGAAFYNNYVSLNGRFLAAASGPSAPVLPFSGADWPLRIKTSLPSRAVGAWLAQAQDSESGGSISVGPGAIDWEQDGDRRLVVRNVAGLQPGRTYRLRFLVLGG